LTWQPVRVCCTRAVPNCLLLVTGAPLALRCADIAAALNRAGWSVQVVTTPAAAAWVDDATIWTVSGQPAISEHRDPREAKRSEAPDAVVVAPATFNTIAKAALGIADTYAHSQLCEVIGAGLPIVMVPMLNSKLWGHPALAGHLRTLIAAGVSFVDPQTGAGSPAPVTSGTGDQVVRAFEPSWIVAKLEQLYPSR
jgi:phosphopantothenoylcysteine synthetase/decarboxylase